VSDNKNSKSGWKVWRFDQMATNVNARIDNPSESGMTHYVGLEHLDADSLKIRRWGTPSDVEATKLMFKTGDIIFGRRRAYQRKLGVAEFDGICSAHAMVLRAKPDVVIPEFLPFFMQSDIFMNRAVEISVGSLSPTINWKTMAVQEFALPPIEEQRRIIEILQCAENTYRELEEAETKANELLRALSLEEFSVSSSEREILASHYSIVSGQIDPREPDYCDLPLIAPNHIESKTGRVLKLESAASQAAISGKYLFEADSVIYSKIRPNLIKAAIAPCRGLCSADMYPLLPKPSIRNGYLLEILLSDEFTQFAVSGSMRTGIPKLNREHLIQYQCKVPPIDHQDEYLAKVHAVRKAASALEARRASISNLKKQIFSEVWGHGVH
jgi:restriction endonuclease S subunit